MLKKLLSPFFWHFDRVFGNNKKIGWQIAFITGLAVLVMLFIGIGGVIARRLPIGYDFSPEAIHAIGLTFGASDLPPDEGSNNFPKWWQAFAFLLGAVFFSGVTITFVGNWLGNRQEAYREGTVRYYFNNHILFLGGSKMLIPMFEELSKNKEYRKQHFVVLTTNNPDRIRILINELLSKTHIKRLKITILQGVRDDEDSLRSVYIEKASRIYIIGEKPSDSDHDSTSIACWNLAKKLCAHRKNIPCFLMLNRAGSVFIFRHNEGGMNSCLDTTIVNRLESVAQRLLVQNGNSQNYIPALDRNGIDKNSKRTVHFVLYGMTAVSYALSTTAAHLCHFPNFVTVDEKGNFGENKERRTKITLIAPNIQEEMAYLTAHLNSLFSISKCSVYGKDWVSDEDAKPWDNKSTMEKVGDFLDIEWEFVDGSIADQKIRSLLQRYYEKNMKGETYLTLAFCLREAERNIAAALYLPYEFHDIKYKNGEIDFENTIPILVFQPESEEMLKTANNEIPMLKNIFPFGSVRESFDPGIGNLINEGKRINYIYSRGMNYAFMTSNQDELDDLWRNIRYADQMSSIYSASHIGVKLRSVGNHLPLTEEETKLLAITEHNRWNVEKLLMGFEALPQSERKMQYDAQGLKELKGLRKQYKHYCIEPYSEMIKNDRDYDTLIVEHLQDII
ncbi:MAG: hypothetical protein K5920_11580 [Bacteroidales bacterium]|nr:hypothetical protein [Bacteroidales bacterium]